MTGLDTENAHPLADLRAQVEAIDREIVDAVNRRIDTVREIWARKGAHGLPTVDPERERALVEHLAAHNRGPLSDEGLRELYATILGLTKREVGGRG